MGYGIGTDRVDVSVRADQSLHDFALEVGSIAGRLVALGCRRLSIDVHERGAVVSGDRAVDPGTFEPEKWKAKVEEIVRGTAR